MSARLAKPYYATAARDMPLRLAEGLIQTT
jgi:hypothetical protein